MKSWPTLLTDISEFPDDIHPNDIIVDAIFGIGLNRETSEFVHEIFAKINALDTFKLAVDIPSGLYADKAPEDLNHVLRVNYTLSFQSPKMVFSYQIPEYLPNNGKY